MLNKFFRENSGATAIEYAVIAALLSVALIGGYSAIGGSLDSKWDSTSSAVDDAGSSYLDNK